MYEEENSAYSSAYRQYAQDQIPERPVSLS